MICNDIAISTPPPVCAQQLRQEKAALKSRVYLFGSVCSGLYGSLGRAERYRGGSRSREHEPRLSPM
jgi:hypothetical protein